MICQLVPSPCISVCQMNPATGLCSGCYRTVDEIVGMGFERETVERVVRMVDRNEYKRRQAPVGIRVTHRSFGKDWRYPNTNRYRG